MLVLTRQVGQAIIIGDNITVKILAVKGSSVELGIAAPKNIPVHREEVYERIKQGGHK